MPGGPHHMGAQNSPLGECSLDDLIGGVLHPQTKRPFRSSVILGLDSAQPPHHVTGLLKRLLDDKLVMKSLVRNVQVCHYFSVSYNASSSFDCWSEPGARWHLSISPTLLRCSYPFCLTARLLLRSQA